MKRNQSKDCETFFYAVDKLIEERLRNLKFNKTQDGIIIGINENGSYQVKINENIHDIYPLEGLSLSVNDIVMVEIINNDFSFKYIKAKRPKVNG